MTTRAACPLGLSTRSLQEFAPCPLEKCSHVHSLLLGEAAKRFIVFDLVALPDQVNPPLSCHCDVTVVLGKCPKAIAANLRITLIPIPAVFAGPGLCALRRCI